MTTNLRTNHPWLWAAAWFLIAAPAPAVAQYRESAGSLGLRVGYDGGANGITYARALGDHLGMECSVGYNDKQGRRLEVPYTQKGNTMLNLNLTPYLNKRLPHTAAVIYGNIGLGARFHHYRMTPADPETKALRGSPVTIDKRAGVGLLVTPVSFLEAFLEINVKHYNTVQNYGAFGTESGIGIRIAMGKPASKSPRLVAMHTKK